MYRDVRRTGLGAFAGMALVAALTLSGCGDDAPTAAPTTGGAQTLPSTVAGGAQGGGAAAPPASAVPAAPHNASDVSFANGMIPHYVQVLATTQIAKGRAVKPQVKTLATTLGTTQVSKIETLSSWLSSWGQPVPGGGPARSGPGLTQADLVQLSRVAPAQFDKLWLTMMIKQQQLALTMAKNEVTHGSSAQAKALAKKLLKEQQSQITAMKALLKQA